MRNLFYLLGLFYDMTFLHTATAVATIIGEKINYKLWVSFFLPFIVSTNKTSDFICYIIKKKNAARRIFSVDYIARLIIIL